MSVTGRPETKVSAAVVLTDVGPAPAQPRRRRSFAGLWFAIPFLAVFLFVLVVPVLYSLYLSVFKDKLIGGRSFSGGELLFVLIAAGRGLLLATPPLSAALTAMGRPSQSIMVNLAINLGLFPLLPPLLLIFGVNGAGWHGLLQAFVAAIWLAAMFRRATPRPRSGAILDD